MKRNHPSRAPRTPVGAWGQAARAVLAPLTRALLDHGFRHADVLTVVEEALLLVALEDGAQTDAAIGRRTGVPKATLERLRRGVSVGLPLPLSYGVAARLAGRWLLEPGFADAGVPKTLPLHGDRSFDILAGMVGVDPALALRELKRVRAVRVTDGAVTLLAWAYVPSAGKLEKLDILARDGAEFLRTMIHNVEARPGAAMLQRKASYDNIGGAALADLREVLRLEGRGALDAANRALAAVDRDRNPSAPGGRRTRVSFGIYVREEAVAPVPRTIARPRKRSRRQS